LSLCRDVCLRRASRSLGRTSRDAMLTFGIARAPEHVP
jgi:hypothetical protein